MKKLNKEQEKQVSGAAHNPNGSSSKMPYRD